MRCPKCGHLEDKVIDSRLVKEGSAVRRRRECESCRKRFTTYEFIERVPLQILKSDGKRQPFYREKLLHGIQIACNKRPIALETIEHVVDEIENYLQELNRKEIRSQEIGELVMQHLYKLDQVAYVRFASVYRQFNDAGQFIEAIRSLPSQID